MLYIANHPHREDRLYVLLALRTLRLVTPSRGVLQKVPFIAALMRLTGTLPMVQGRSAFSVCQDTLLNGKNVLIFPQGKTTRERKTVHSGALKLSLATGCQITPILIKGRFRVQIGEPFMPDASMDIMEKVWELEG